MREFRIKVPDLKDGKRVVGATRERVAAASSEALEKAQTVGGRVHDRVDDLEAPHINLLDAHRLVRDTKNRVEAAEALLQREHDETAAEMQHLGETELRVYDGPIRDFVGLFERMKNVELSDLTHEDVPEFVRSFDIDVRKVDFSEVDALKGLGAGSTAGAAAGVIAFAAVGSLASASTGTAISALSGAAATNATLAWLGGGTIAAGGAGVAGGMVVLGGIVALPVLAIGGLVVHHEGRKALAEAKQDATKANVAIKEMETACAATRAIRLRATRIASLVEQLADLARVRNGVLRHLVERNNDYATYDDYDRGAVMVAASVAKTLRTVMDVPVIEEDGTLTGASSEAIKAADQLLADSRHVES
jgi:hypothetical protein